MPTPLRPTRAARERPTARPPAPWPQTPRETLGRIWAVLTSQQRLEFLTDVLMPAERRALQVGWEDADVCDEDGARARSSITWQFVRGDRVVVATDGGSWIGTILLCRVTLRDVLGPYFEYFVQDAEGGSWVDEADLTLAKEPTP